ncbi:class I SAM-dependent DNA methyltransferase [Cellulosilyticum sp. I15G10I2]|uniref:class I SAM-dependent DNA methyltransferase n=1 Tax=Cellulosilyticum sp. I15G10I2 TaxID=1892843 RepID=UPI00085BE4C3|nr:class I SAM-dependent methyltransferase [Cellulosilyticum sp. I15G10I2]
MGSIKIWDFWASKYEGLWVQKYSLSPTRREIIKEIRKIIKPSVGYHILDMGCGTGQLIREMQEVFKDVPICYTGVDISPKMIEAARSRDKCGTYINCSVQDFSDAKEAYDIVVCSHSFPYYPSKEKVFHKFRGLLKEEGTLLLAQASVNTVYDMIAMFFVKFTTSSAEYLSLKKIQALAKGSFKLMHIQRIKEKWFMPSICLFVFKKDGNGS